MRALENNTFELQRTMPTLWRLSSISCHGHHHYRPHGGGKDGLACAENVANTIHPTINTFLFISAIVNVKVRLYVLSSI